MSLYPIISRQEGPDIGVSPVAPIPVPIPHANKTRELSRASLRWAGGIIFGDRQLADNSAFLVQLLRAVRVERCSGKNQGMFSVGF